MKAIVKFVKEKIFSIQILNIFETLKWTVNFAIRLFFNQKESYFNDLCLFETF